MSVVIKGNFTGEITGGMNEGRLSKNILVGTEVFACWKKKCLKKVWTVEGATQKYL